MGTKMQCKSYLPGYYSVRDLNEDPNNCSWPLYYGDKTLPNTQYYNGFLQRAPIDAYQGYGKDAVKQTMLKHEAIFKNQVYELHRVYRIQRDLMDEIKRKELHRNHMPVETSLSSSPLASQITSEQARKWPDSSFPLVNSVYVGQSSSGAEGIHSQSSAIKGNGQKNGLYPCQNGTSSKDVELLDSRPTKVRKKMFDLQLPADVYIDSEEGEECSDEKVSGMPSYQSTKNCEIAPEGGGKVFFGDGRKTDHAGDALRSERCPRSANGFADLNEPIEPEEASASGYADPPGHDSFRGKIQIPDLPDKSRSQFLGDGARNGWFSHVLESGQNKSNLKVVSQCLQTERLPISSQPVQVSANNVHEQNFYLTDKSKVDLWRESTVSGVESCERSNEFSSNKHQSTFIASNVPSPYPILSSDLAKSWNLSVSSWEKPSSSLSQKSMLGQAHQCFNSSATLSKSSQSSVQSNGIFGDRWHLNNSSRSNQGSGSELPYQNGFNHGSSSGSKEQLVRFPSLNCDYQSSSNNHNGGSEQLMSYGSATYYKGSNLLDVKSAKEVNLNVMVSNSSSNEEIPQRGLKIMGGQQKHDDPLAALPWLRAKPAGKNEFANGGSVSKTGEPSFFQSSVNNSSNKIEAGKGFNQIFTSVKSFSCGNDDEARRTELADSPSNRKLLGFPIFGKSQLSKNESFSLTSPSVSIPHPSESDVENNRRNRLLDINLPCDTAAPDLARKNVAGIVMVEDGRDKQFGNLRRHIDLNFCISDDEASLKPSAPRTSMKIAVEIDLEAPISLETDDEDDVIHGEASAEKQNKMSLALPHKETEPSRDELAREAAEAIVAISSCGVPDPMDESSCNLAEASLVDPLMWFVDIVSTCGNDLDSKFDTVMRSDNGEGIEESLVEEFDYFEFLTLKLKETKEEDYMPKPLVPENLKFEDSGTNLLSNTPRRGQSRRGRQRRDFQRDILPGLVSLSRHEVTEDIQTFGGLMRATGHPSWQSGLARRNSTRNGSARGRRRAVVSPSPPVVIIPACTPPIQQFSNTEMALEDRSLTGWGKTTRRPRRQRCAAGNPPSVPLT
ncbi:PREDICTED: uncharacterized protein LOC101294655 [Fragaria vesca subsp. vesca]|uniref:uncharacterized protein LOC101294655 n=1 Tax=Fragaria vesca subsp. vesca TaxID=101020 RepID=UPI0002C3174E|nr:PREDICTED: uncharacterized protein LOC101294655 [Fragaria vesca subsp. vesca]